MRVEKTQAVGGEAVEVRGLDLRTVAADVGVAEVIGEDDEDVGLLGGVEDRAEKEAEG